MHISSKSTLFYKMWTIRGRLFSIFHYRFLKFYLKIKNFELKFDLMYRRILYVCNAYIYILYTFGIGGMTGGKYRKRDVCCIVWDLRWRVFLIFDCFDSISQKFYSIYILRNDFFFICGFSLRVFKTKNDFPIILKDFLFKAITLCSKMKITLK